MSRDREFRIYLSVTIMNAEEDDPNHHGVSTAEALSDAIADASNAAFSGSTHKVILMVEDAVEVRR